MMNNNEKFNRLKKKILLFLIVFFLFTIGFSNAQAANLANQLKGKLLLQVENKGEVWYVNPDDSQRYEVTLLNSLPLFRKFALGINTEDLNKIPMIHQSISKDFGLNLKGKFLLDVENRGKIWYIDFNGFRHEIRQDNLLSLFQNLSLGISNKNLTEIPIGVLLPQSSANGTSHRKNGAGGIPSAGEEETIQIEEVEISTFNPESLENDSDFDNFWELWKMIKEKYVGEISNIDLLEGAKRGLVEALGDDYSIFMNKEESGEFLDDLSGQFEGIGAEVSIKNGELTVVAPLPDMPAEKAGILAGDIILEIDGNSTVGMTLNKSVSLIKGEKDSSVILKVRHNNDEEEDITIIRGLVTYASLTYEIREDNIAYIRMIRFNSDASSSFQEAVDYISDKGVSGIILDLRNNPGGYMSAAVDVAGYWVGPENIVTEKYKDEFKIDEHISKQKAVLGKIPTVVLVNKGSASASEIVAGALQDYGSATIIGEKTFGKGSVQELRSLADGSYVKLTIAKWYTPNGHSINGKGILPDLIIKNLLTDYVKDIDTQLEEALKLLK